KEEAAATTAPPPEPAEDPNGPRAKTAELKAPAGATPSSAPETEAVGVAASADVSSTQPSPEVSDTANGRTDPEPIPETVGAQTHETSTSSETEPEEPAPQDDLGEVFGRVMALSQTLTHPAFVRALAGFAQNGRVYLVYHDEELAPVQGHMSEAEAVSAAIQVAQAIAFVHRRGLRLNDICPQSIAITRDHRLRLTSLDDASNDNELQDDPIFNDGYTAPEGYRGRQVDKRADIFSAAALLYTWLTRERLESESWREEAGQIRFYPPHVVTPDLEQVIRRALLFDPKSRWSTIEEFKTELIKLMSEIEVHSAALTDVGMVREHNEDSVLSLECVRESLLEPDQNFLHVVCDGMGGAEAGEVASAIAVATIRSYVQERLAGNDAKDPSKLMISALEEANSRILSYQNAHPESRGMGSTAVGTLIIPPNAAVAWVGDSRAYLLTSGTLRPITKDHSLVQRLLEIGQITAEEARNHEHKNVVTRTLGARQSGPAGAEGVSLRLKRGDSILLCSDGLTSHVDDAEISKILKRHNDPYG